MIKAEEKGRGTMVAIDGSTVDVIIELADIIQGVYQMLENRYGEDFARETIAMSGKLAFAEDDETKISVIGSIAETLLKKGESK